MTALKRPTFTSPLELKVEATVNPSEDPEKVIDAITKVVNRCSPEFRYGSRVIGRATGHETLANIYEQIRSRSAMGVLRRMLVDNRAGQSTWFLLNKQAASVGIASVVEDDQESPLGPIRVTLNCEELDAVVDWIVPEFER